MFISCVWRYVYNFKHVCFEGHQSMCVCAYVYEN